MLARLVQIVQRLARLVGDELKGRWLAIEDNSMIQTEQRTLGICTRLPYQL